MNKLDSLKQRACEAKHRLQTGYLDTNDSGLYSEKFANNMLTLMKNKETLRKICEIVESNEMDFNPLSKLIDKELLSQLSVVEQQRYIFRLSEAYIHVKNIYETNCSRKF